MGTVQAYRQEDCIQSYLLLLTKLKTLVQVLNSLSFSYITYNLASTGSHTHAHEQT